MVYQFDEQGWQEGLDAQLKKSRDAFDGIYGPQLRELAALSQDEIDAISPGTIDLQQYDALITVVKEASVANINQARLKVEIEKLGQIAVEIAKKIPTLAALW